MKKGFTLVEMLIVVVVLITLMSITFKLSSVGGDQNNRSKTIARMQKIENCLSGYYAAYGTYPPVKAHATYDYNLEVSGSGLQMSTTRENNFTSDNDWNQVKAVCLAQPIACRFPYMENGDKEISEYASDLGKGSADDGYSSNPGRHINSADWQVCHLFQFGMMSFLLPRYLIMMNGSDEFFNGNCDLQWKSNNALPADPLSYGAKFNNWREIKDYVYDAHKNDDKKAYARVANIPSQSIPIRWMPNLEKTCYHNCESDKVYLKKCCGGIDIKGGDTPEINCFFTPGDGDQTGSANQYEMHLITVVDGWKRELFYYSPPPYQSYTLWSGGANEKTFPPWMSKEGLSSDKLKRISEWIADDILHMSN